MINLNVNCVRFNIINKVYLVQPFSQACVVKHSNLFTVLPIGFGTMSNLIYLKHLLALIILGIQIAAFT